MKKSLFVVVVLLFILDIVIIAADPEITGFSLSPENGKVKVEVSAYGGSIYSQITEARLDYWWDEEIHTYVFPKSSLGSCTFGSKVYFTEKDIPLDKVIHFELTIRNNEGNEVKQTKPIYYFIPFDWDAIPWKQMESPHVILFYKLKYNIAKQILDIAEDAYLGVSKLLKEEMKEKIPIMILDGYEHICLESGVPGKNIHYGHWGGYQLGGSAWIMYEPSWDYEVSHRLKLTIAHEMTHIFQGNFFFAPYDSSDASIWFSDVMAQYVSAKVTFGDKFAVEMRKSLTKERLIEHLSSPLWNYSWGIRILFFDYLFDKYKTKDVNTAIKAFVKSKDFERTTLPKDFFSYLSTRFSIPPDLLKKELGSYPRKDVCIGPFCSYNMKMDRVLVSIYPTFYTQEYIYNDIGILNLRDMKMERLTYDCFYESTPIWSKDEKSIYYVMKNGPEYSIMNMRLKDENITKLYTTDDFIFDLSLSPDGKKIVFSKREDLYRASLWILDLKTGKAMRITSGRYLDVSPVFYKTNKILFISNRMNGKRAIFKMDLDERKSYIIPNTDDSYEIISVANDKCLFRARRDWYFNDLSVLDLESGRVKRYFGEGCHISDIWDVWFPVIHDGKLHYYEGEALKNLIPKEIPLD